MPCEFFFAFSKHVCLFKIQQLRPRIEINLIYPKYSMYVVGQNSHGVPEKLTCKVQIDPGIKIIWYILQF